MVANRWHLAGLITCVAAFSSHVHGMASCGDKSTSGYATSPDDAERNSIFAFTFDNSTAASTVLTQDADGHKLQFVGNSFLIDVFESGGRKTGYFATAKHNLMIACKTVTAGPLPKIRFVSTEGKDFQAEGPSPQQCKELLDQYQEAGTNDIIFNPDLIILKAALTTGGWKPLMVATALTDSFTGEVMRLETNLSQPLSEIEPLPHAVPEASPFAKYGWVRVIHGYNPPGASGSPFVTTDNGHLVAVGILTNYIPPGGAPLIGGGARLSSQEMLNLLASMVPRTNAESSTLVSSLDVLDQEYDAKAASSEVPDLFDQASEKNYKDRDVNADLQIHLTNSGLAGIVYLKQKCNDLFHDDNFDIPRMLFCAKVFSYANDRECFYSYDDYIQVATKMFNDRGNGVFPSKGATIRVVNDLRPLAESAQPPVAKAAASVLDAVLSQPRNSHLVSQHWDSGSRYDLALLERKGGAGEKDYLARLKEAISVDSNNEVAKRAYVDAAVNFAKKTSDVAYLPTASSYLNDLSKSGAMSPGLVRQTSKDILALKNN